MNIVKMISYKTAVLVGASLKMGAIIGKASLEDQNRIYDFGLNLGIAFQLQDDYLDTFGTQDFGKKIGGDIIEGKKTFLYIKAMELADSMMIKSNYWYFMENCRSEDKKISEVKSIFTKYSVAEMLAHWKLKNYHQGSSMILMHSLLMFQNSSY